MAIFLAYFLYKEEYLLINKVYIFLPMKIYANRITDEIGFQNSNLLLYKTFGHSMIFYCYLCRYLLSLFFYFIYSRSVLTRIFYFQKTVFHMQNIVFLFQNLYHECGWNERAVLCTELTV